jgi:hypothetical protein
MDEEIDGWREMDEEMGESNAWSEGEMNGERCDSDGWKYGYGEMDE